MDTAEDGRGVEGRLRANGPQRPPVVVGVAGLGHVARDFTPRQGDDRSGSDPHREPEDNVAPLSLVSVVSNPTLGFSF